MPAKRDSLRVWLEKNLNGNKIRGLEWKDQKKKIFRIAWKHASKHGWSSAIDGCVFREWAIYSGKFKPEEKNHEQPKVWKANFRCALNALADIQEIRDERQTRGNNAQKIFHMKPHVTKQSKRSQKSSFRSKRQASSPYITHYQEPNMIHFRKRVLTRGSSLNVRPWSENPPPLLQIRNECCSSPERSSAFPSHVRTITENETILPENKIIELIDSWSSELKKEQEERFCTSLQQTIPGWSNGFTEPSVEVYQSPAACSYQIQSHLFPISHYYLTPDASEESTCSEYVSHI